MRATLVCLCVLASAHASYGQVHRKRLLSTIASTITSLNAPSFVSAQVATDAVIFGNGAASIPSVAGSSSSDSGFSSDAASMSSDASSVSSRLPLLSSSPRHASHSHASTLVTTGLLTDPTASGSVIATATAVAVVTASGSKGPSTSYSTQVVTANGPSTSTIIAGSGGISTSVNWAYVTAAGSLPTNTPNSGAMRPALAGGLLAMVSLSALYTLI